MSRLHQIEKEIANESALGLLLAPYREVYELDRRTLIVNNRIIQEREMSDGTFRVYISGMRTDMSYQECIKWAGGR
jgi:hypothetical protein